MRRRPKAISRGRPTFGSFRLGVLRAHRAHLNLLEPTPPFSQLALAAQAAEVSTAVTVWATAGIFWLRCPGRPIAFSAGWFRLFALAVETSCSESSEAFAGTTSHARRLAAHVVRRPNAEPLAAMAFRSLVQACFGAARAWIKGWI